VNQEFIDRAAKSGTLQQISIKATMLGFEAQSSMNDRHPSLQHASERPLPQPPATEVPSSSRSDLADVSPRSKRRPSATSGSSTQKPKKRVIWKGKVCTIALPFEDDRGTRPLLTPGDVTARMEQWQNEGLDTHGFNLSSSPADEGFGGQTCGLYPDPVYVLKERERGECRVSIPNQADWDAYVEFLKEQKLRALGVTSSDSGHPGSTRSPFPSSFSRASSRLPGQPLSPPVPSSSAASNIPLSNGGSFSPAFHASNASSRVGSVASFLPQFPPSQNGMHHSNKSLAHSAVGPRVTSPFNLYALRPTPLVQQELSPSACLTQCSDRLSPPAPGVLQSLGQVLSSVSPPLEGINAGQSNALLAQVGHQQGSQSDFVPYQRHQRSYTETAPLNHLPTPSICPSNAEEIIHPAPQGHQRNISEALQKEIDAAEEAVQTSEKLVQANVTTAAPSGMENTHDLELSSSLQRDEDGKDANDFRFHGQRSKPHEAVSQPVSSKTEKPIASASQPGLNGPPHATDHTMPDLPNSIETLPSQRVNALNGHKATPSISKLNVEAEEFKFDPKSQFSSSNFVFGGDAFQASVSGAVPSYSTSGSYKAVLPKPIMATGLNADAPSFAPSMFHKGDSQFNSATFHVGAPAFNPGRVIRKDVSDESIGANSAGAADKIFTKVTIDPNGKATRRGKVPKALPIRQPEDEEHTEDDEDGRVQVSAARQKRARIQDNGDDTTPYTTTMPLKDECAHAIFSETASKSEEPITSGSEDAVRRSSADMSHVAVTRKEDQEESVTDDGFAGAMDTPLRMQELSPQRDPDVAQDEKEEMTMPSLVERNIAGDSMAANENGADSLPDHHPAASVSALLVNDHVNGHVNDHVNGHVNDHVNGHVNDHVNGHVNDHVNGHVNDKSSDSSPLTSKPRKSIGLEALRYAATPPSSPPATSTRRELLLQQLASEDTDLSLTLKSAGSGEGGHDRIYSHNANLDTAGEHVTLEAYPDDVERSAPPSGSLSPRSPNGAERDATVPSYHEIDAVMKQFEDNPDLGVERVEKPPMLPRPTGGLFLNPSINIRSDAPSPSPRRKQMHLEPLHELKGIRLPLDRSSSGVGIRSSESSPNRAGGAEISDWNDALLVADESKFEIRTQFLDTHVNSLVGGILEDRLGPLERTLTIIRHSIDLLANQQHRNRRRTSTSDDMKHSDADDEEEDTSKGGMARHRTRSPMNQNKDRKSDIIKTAVMEALAAHKQGSPSPKETDQTAFEQLMSELRSLKGSSMSKQGPDEIRTVVEEVISTHPRLRGKRVQEDHEAGGSHKFRLQIDGLESMLKVANERAEEDYRARRKVEDDLAETDRQLNLMEEEAAQYREASEEAERSLRTYCEERDSFRDLEYSNSELALKNAALETTLEEYRLSHDQWRIDIDDERKRNKDLKAVLQSLRREIEEDTQIKQGLRAKLERLQDDMAEVMERVAHDQASWMRKEHGDSAKHKELEAELHRETRMRQKMELELDELDKEHKGVLKFRETYDVAQKENERLEALVAQWRQESRTHEDAAHGFQREVEYLRDISAAETSKARSTYEHDVRLLKSHHDSVSADFEGQVSRLQAQLQQTRDDGNEVKAKHQSHLGDHIERQGRALHELNESKEAALAEQRRSHEKALNDLRERHARALHNASDDKHRLEALSMEKIALSSDKIQHLEEKVADLQERLEITSSAARAAAVAAAEKGASELDIHPTPQSNAASMPFARGSDIPAKISPQALRESIMVLQDQLQNREQTIESLEAELAKIDKDAPANVKDRDTEITWLRELLGVRIDDLEEIIHSLSEPEHDREAVKDAVIRLKANLQMEQQEKERAAQSNPGGFPSMASLSSLTQTPRALPMAAAAAWGNWRKARDTSFSTLSGLANMNNHTPSRSSASPQSFLSGLLTPPSTSQRQATPPPGSAPPTMMNLNARKSSSEARPLRAYSSQARRMSARQTEKRPLRRQQSSDHTHTIEQKQQQKQLVAPSTPPLMRDSSYDRDADARKSIMSDIDDDVSPMGSGLDGGGSSLGEPFEESAR